jgi:hypothetical protein
MAVFWVVAPLQPSSWEVSWEPQILLDTSHVGIVIQGHLELYYFFPILWNSTHLTTVVGSNKCHFLFVLPSKYCHLSFMLPDSFSFLELFCFDKTWNFFLFTRKTPTQLITFVFRKRARSGELKQLSIHNVWPRSRRGSIRFNTMAAVLYFAGSISGLGSSIFAPVYTKKDHRYPVFDSHSSNVFISNLAALRGMYCLNQSRPFQRNRVSSIVMFYSGR